MTNPFDVKTPETLSEEQVALLFADVFTDIASLKQVGHTFMHGARGSGKSMMFRYLLPEVQWEVVKQTGSQPVLSNLDFFAIHFPIRDLDIGGSIQHEVENDFRISLIEHYFIMKIMFIYLQSLEKNFLKFNIDQMSSSIKYIYIEFCELCADYTIKVQSKDKYLNSMIATCLRETRSISQYLKKDLNQPEIYKGGITNFIDFLSPIVKLFNSLDYMPKNSLYLLIDDADNLPPFIQKILNTWVSYRSTNVISLKISTQLRYATYRTTSGVLIENPHDFNSVDLTQIYTSKTSSYYHDRLLAIIGKRLKLANLDTTPHEFFPEDLEQKAKIELEKEAIKLEYLKKKVSARLTDDTYRYAIPNYMTRLQESKKSNLFSYSGLKTLIDLSSGIIRFFLESASKMVEEVQKQEGYASANDVKYISQTIQSSISREWSNDFIGSEFEAIKQDSKRNDTFGLTDAESLLNLLNSLGQLFGRKLLDKEATERRVFSIMTEENLPDDLERIIRLGISFGYLHRSSIRGKEKVGRKLEIILSRRLAPHYYLDVSGYSGRLSVMNIEDLRLACKSPSKFVNKRLKIDGEEEANLKSNQALFSEID